METKDWARPIYITVFAIAILLALFLRFYKLGQVPPALNGDEAVFGSGALHILQNGPVLSTEGQGGGGVLASYIVALFFLLAEPGKMALRFQASLFGALAVVLLFFSAREIFAEQGKSRAGLIGAFSALLMAIGHTQVTISRIAFAIVHLPVLQLLAIFLFWKAWQKQNRIWLVWAGLALALVLYGYIAGIFTPVLLIAFIILCWLGKKTLGWWGLPFSLKTYALYWGLPFLLGAIPFAWSLIVNANSGSSGRITETSFLNPLINQGNPLGALWYGLWGNFAAFGLTPLQWLAQGQWPAFLSSPLTLLIFAGVIIALLRLKKAPYLFLLLWWGATILPAALAPFPVPYASRAIGVFAPLSIFGGLALTQLTLWLAEGFRKKRWFKLAGAGLVLLWALLFALQSAWEQYNHYFNIWPYQTETLDSYDFYAPELAQRMAELSGPDSAFILPRNTSAGSVSPNGSVNFYYQLQNTASPHYWLADDETTIPVDLTAAAQSANTLHIIDWRITKHSGADPKEVFTYYLEKYGALSETHAFEHYDIRSYALNAPATDFSAAEALTPAEANFAHQLALQGYAFGNAGPGQPQRQQVSAGDMLWTRLKWQKLSDHPEDLKVSLILQDEQGHKITAIDKHLQNNLLHQRSSQWPVESEAETYFLLPLPADIMPGAYQLGLTVYGENSLAPLPIAGNGTVFSLGQVDVLPARDLTEPPWPDNLKPVGTLADGLALHIQEQGLPQNAQPGQSFSVPLFWHSEGTPTADYAFSISLNGGGEGHILQDKQPLGGDLYPTGLWRPGERLRQWHSLRLPPGLNGAYTLTVNIWQGDDLAAEWPLSEFYVADWPHTFTLPNEARPVSAVFDNTIELAGYAVNQSQPGEVNLTLFWRANDVVKEDLVAFVHLLSAEGQLLAQIDRIPADGTRPVSGWLPQEIIADSYTLALPPDAASEGLSVAVGLYNPHTFQRLPVQTQGQSDDKVIIVVE